MSKGTAVRNSDYQSKPWKYLMITVSRAQRNSQTHQLWTVWEKAARKATKCEWCQFNSRDIVRQSTPSSQQKHIEYFKQLRDVNEKLNQWDEIKTLYKSQNVCHFFLLFYFSPYFIENNQSDIEIFYFYFKKLFTNVYNPVAQHAWRLNPWSNQVQGPLSFWTGNVNFFKFTRNVSLLLQNMSINYVH